MKRLAFSNGQILSHGSHLANKRAASATPVNLTFVFALGENKKLNGSDEILFI